MQITRLMAMQYTVPEAFRAAVNLRLRSEPETPWNRYFTTEGKFQSAVQQWMKGMPSPWLAYHTHDSNRSTEGFPDLFAVNPRCGCEIVAEIKSMSPKADLSLDQASWVLAYALDPDRNVFIWRPSDEGEIMAWLQRHQDRFLHASERHAVK